MFTTIDAPSRADRGAALLRALALAFVAAIAFATLWPLGDWRLRASGPFAFLAGGLPRYWTWFDVLSNAAAYAVLGLLLTLGFLQRAAPWRATLAVAAFGSLLSLSLEAAQAYLPNRVPSLLDWMANSGGALAGAWLGATLGRAGGRGEATALPASERWYEQGPPMGWVLLILWLAAQLVPQRLLFATGHGEPALQRLLDRMLLPDAPDLSRTIDAWWGGAGAAGYGVAIEAAAVMCAVVAVGAIAFELVHGVRRRLALIAGIALLAFGLRSLATQMVYGAGAPFAWLTPGAQGGLVVGAALLYGLETLGARARAACGLAAAIAGWVLVNVAPQDRYFETTLAGVQAGQLANLHGLLRTVSFVWPILAIVWFWRRARRAGARSL